MRGAFFQAMDEFKSGNLSPEVKSALGISDVKGMNQTEKMAAAYRYAEYALEHVNTVPLPTLQSGLHLGNWFEQTLGNFGSDAVRAQQLYKTSLRNMKRSPSAKTYRRFAALTVGLFLLEPLHYILINYARQQVNSKKKPPGAEAIAGAFSGRTDKASVDARKYLAYEFVDQAAYYFPIARDVVGPLAATATGQYAGNSGMLITDEMIRLGMNATKAATQYITAPNDTERQRRFLPLLDNGTHFIFALLGVPYTSPKFYTLQIKKWIEEGSK